MRSSFAGWEKSIAGLWTRSKRQKWQQTDRQHSRKLREPPNELSGIICATQFLTISAKSTGSQKSTGSTIEFGVYTLSCIIQCQGPTQTAGGTAGEGSPLTTELLRPKPPTPSHASSHRSSEVDSPGDLSDAAFVLWFSTQDTGTYLPLHIYSRYF